MWWSVTNAGNRVHLDTYLFHEVLYCCQFYPVSGTLSMNKERKDDSPSVYSINSGANLVAVKSRDTYFKKRKKKTTLILLCLSLIVSVLLVGIITFGVTYINVRAGRISLCDTEDCIRTAASLKESMDMSIDPCDDFYKYACGRWSENHPTIDANVMNSWFNEKSDRVTRKVRDLLKETLNDEKVPWAVEQAKVLYKSCLDEDSKNALGLTPTLNLLQELTLPQIPPILAKEKGNFIEKIARVRRLLGKDVFIGIDVMVDPRNKSRNVIVLDTPSAPSPLPGDSEIQKRLKTVRAIMAAQIQTDSDEEEELASIEKSYITAIMMEIISNGTWTSCDSFDEKSSVHETDVKKVAERIYELTGALYYMSKADSNETITEESINDGDYMLIDDLQKITDEFVRSENDSLNPMPFWRPFVEQLFANIVDLDLDKKDKILVANLGYCKDLALFLTSTEDEMLETVIWWIVLDVVAPHSSKNMRKIWAEYIDKLIHIENYEPMSFRCADVVNYMMGMAVARVFVDPEFHVKTEPKVVEMLEHIRDSFASLVATTGWMDEETKIATLEKSNKMAYVIGHPNWLFNDETLNEYYEGINMENNTYLQNMLMIAREATKTELQFLREPDTMNKIYWAADPTEVNAVYTIIANHITIPAGILQFPFYKLGLEALNYGAIGAILGHELTHGFDNSGRLYDSDGNLRQWWSNDTIIEYMDKTECFIKHYGSYYEEEVDKYVDGELTLDENIADNGGLREAIHAYQRWKAKHGQEPHLPGFTHLTHEQLLFLGFAHLWCEAYTPESLRWSLRDSHSPGHVRLKAVLANSKEFSETWYCPVGSPMNPDKKCRIW